MRKLLLLALVGLHVLPVSQAQTPTDAFMMERSQICAAALYQNDRWDTYWEGAFKRQNGNIGTLTRQTAAVMAVVGLSDRFNLIASLPWISAEASGGQMAGYSGFQDLGLWAKAQVARRENERGRWTAFGVLGFTTPIANYPADYQPFSPGLGATSFSGRFVGQYHHKPTGLFVQAHSGYEHRRYARIERDFYYADGPFYTNLVDVPDATTWGATLGAWLFDNSLRIETVYSAMRSLGGVDIRRHEMPFPANRMHFDRLAGGFQYYMPFVKGLSLIGSYAHTLHGRNMGQSAILTGGIAWQFTAWK